MVNTFVWDRLTDALSFLSQISAIKAQPILSRFNDDDERSR